MRNALRLLTVAAAATAALALAAPALAAYDSPRLQINNSSERISGGGTVSVQLSIDRGDDPTARIVIYFPQGYTGNLAPAAGTQIGTVAARAQSLASPDIVVPLQGVVRTANPGGVYTAPAAQCLGTATPDVDSVWLLVITSPTGGADIVIPGYLTVGLAGAEAAVGQAKLTVCLPTPAASATQTKVFGVTLALAGLTNPASAGSYRWRALFTPYASNSGPVNPAGTVEVQSVDTIPARITIRPGRYNRRTQRLPVTGQVTEVTTGVAASVRILLNGRRVATVRANARGQYRTNVRIRRAGRYTLRAETTVPARTVTGCQGINPAIRCLRTVVSGFTITSANARVRIRR